MKRLFFRNILAALLTLVIIPAGLAEVTDVSTSKPSCCSKTPSAAGPISDQSLYQLDSTWTNQLGAALKLGSLRGKPVVLTMFFAKCQYACPILAHDMRRIEAALPENSRTNVNFVMVSFDSERDTPEALAAYRRNHELGSNWTLLRGNPDDILELGALLGVKFKKESSGQFAHSNIITILNAEGQILHQQIGLNQAVTETVAKIERAAHAGKVCVAPK